MDKVTEAEKTKNELMDLEFQLKARDVKIQQLEGSSDTMDEIKREYAKVTDELRKSKESLDKDLGEKKEQISALNKKIASLENEIRAHESAQKSRLEHAEKRSEDAVHSKDE